MYSILLCMYSIIHYIHIHIILLHTSSEIPTKLDDFLEFQWKQGVEFLSHQQGYLDGKLMYMA